MTVPRESPEVVTLWRLANDIREQDFDSWVESLPPKMATLGKVGNSVTRQHERWSRLFGETDKQAVGLVKEFRWRWLNDEEPKQARPQGPWEPKDPEWTRARDIIVAKLFESGNVEWAPEGEDSDAGRGQWIHTLFCVEKKGKPFEEGRPILNVKGMNKFIVSETFKMEGISTIKELVRRGNKQSTFDLTESFHQIGVIRPYRRFLRFWAWDKERRRWRLAQYLVLTMGHTNSPRVLTRVMRAPFGLARELGITCSRFVDDAWISERTTRRTMVSTIFIVELLIFLGWHFNLKKSELQPTSKKIYLGFEIDLSWEVFSIFYPADKVDKVWSSCVATLALWRYPRFGPPDARFVSKTIGQLMACSEAIHGIRLHMAGLIEALGSAISLRGCYDDPCPGTEAAMNDLEHWIEHLADWNGKGLWREKEPSILIQTDACGHGWGSTTVPSMNGKVTERMIQGSFNEDERLWHINAKEVTGAAEGALDTMTYFDLWSEELLIETDNTVTESYVNKMGGRKVLLTCLLWPMFREAYRRGCTITARHLPGVKNLTADWTSREFGDLIEARLRRRIYCMVVSRTRGGDPTVDLFADDSNHRCRCFISRRWTPGSQAITADAENTDWAALPQGRLYAFPPMARIPHALRRVEESGRQVLAILPAWPTAVWWPTMLRLLEETPLIIDRSEGAVTTPWNEENKVCLILPWCLIAVNLSGAGSDVAALQRARSIRSSLTGKTAADITMRAGRSGRPSRAAEACFSMLLRTLTSRTF